MSFKSQNQAKYMFSQHPKTAKEFASKTPSIKSLPISLNRNNKVKVLGALRNSTISRPSRPTRPTRPIRPSMPQAKVLRDSMQKDMNVAIEKAGKGKGVGYIEKKYR
ncbi:MAG: hypothetical protein AAB706_00870 [Patescibacteria group bacterium]